MKEAVSYMLPVCAVLSLTGCVGSQSRLNIENAQTIVLMDGNTGASVEITDADTVRIVMDNFNSLQLKKDRKNDSTGWTYGIRWYDANGKEIESVLSGANPMSIARGNYVWTVTRGSIDTAVLDELLGR